MPCDSDAAAASLLQPCRLPPPPTQIRRTSKPPCRPLLLGLPASSFLLLFTLLAAAAGVRMLVGVGMKAWRGESHVGAGRTREGAVCFCGQTCESAETAAGCMGALQLVRHAYVMFDSLPNVGSGGRLRLVPPEHRGGSRFTPARTVACSVAD